MTKSH